MTQTYLKSKEKLYSLHFCEFYSDCVVYNSEVWGEDVVVIPNGDWVLENREIFVSSYTYKQTKEYNDYLNNFSLTPSTLSINDYYHLKWSKIGPLILIPTNNKTSLARDPSHGYKLYMVAENSGDMNILYQNMYVVNDDVIDEKDWYIEVDPFSNIPLLRRAMNYLNKINDSHYCKKVILSTDTNIINDRVKKLEKAQIKAYIQLENS